MSDTRDAIEPAFIEYSKGYKYQLRRKYWIALKLPWKTDVSCGFVSLSDGVLTIEHGYAWDGPSGPTVDTKTFMRGSLVHDALYQLIRNFPGCVSRKFADDTLRKICREDGMSRVRAWYVYRAVRVGARRSSLPSAARKTLRAPS